MSLKYILSNTQLKRPALMHLWEAILASKSLTAENVKLNEKLIAVSFQ